MTREKTFLDTALEIIQDRSEKIEDFMNRSALSCPSTSGNNQIRSVKGEREQLISTRIDKYYKLVSENEKCALHVVELNGQVGFDLYDLNKHEYLGTHGRLIDPKDKQALASLRIEEDKPMTPSRKYAFYLTYGLEV